MNLSKQLYMEMGQVHIKSILDDLAQNEYNDEPIGIYIFGAGERGVVLQRYLQKHDSFSGKQVIIRGYFDNDESKHGTMLNGFVITIPQVHLIDKTDYVFIASSVYGAEMEQQLRKDGLAENKIIPSGDYLQNLLQQPEVLSNNDNKQHCENEFLNINKKGDIFTQQTDFQVQEIAIAKEKSRSKKTILVLDHHVPFYDQDAGGRCTYQYLKLFLELGLHVIFVGDYYKHEPYTLELERMGIRILYGKWYKENFSQWLKENGKFIDYAYLNRPYIAQPVIDDIRNFSQAKIFYFAHDLHFLREYRQYQVERKPQLLVSAEKIKKIEYEVFNKADVIHVVGSYEQEYLQNEFPGKIIRNIPLFIADDIQFEDFNKNSFEVTKDIMFVGGFNHTPNQDAMLWFLNKIFPSIVEQISDIKLYIVGSNPTYSLRRIKHPNIVVTGFVSDEELRDYYKKIRLVVAPLRYGAGIKGKIIEAMLHRTPVITTSIGVEGLSDIAGKIMVSDSEASFAEAVITVYQDKYMWEKQSLDAFCYAKQSFSRERAIEICLSDMLL